jgi:hypothetical protein
MRMKTFAILDKAKPDTENVRGLNLAAFRVATGQVAKLPFRRKLSKIRCILLYKLWSGRWHVLVHIYARLYICLLLYYYYYLVVVVVVVVAAAVAVM